MAKEIVKIGVANGPQINLEVEVVKAWLPKEINAFGDTTFFKHDGIFYSMKRDDFNKIYTK